MRKSLLIALGGAVALVAAVAARAVVVAASGVSATTAAFAADKVTEISARTCTGADGKTFTVTSGHYTGTADFTNPATDLDGPLTINARTRYSTTDGLGYVEGTFRVRDDASRVSGKLSGTLRGTQFVGFLTATSRGNHARILGNVSATFAPSIGFSAGVLGSTSSTTVLAVIAGPVCKGAKPSTKPATKPVSVKGQVSAVGDGSVGSTITVRSKGPSTATCTRDATSPSTTGFTVGTRVEMKCTLIGSTWTLRELKRRK